MEQSIKVTDAYQNNLKHISVSVPIGAVTAITGVAGAGKSSLAFDVLHAEGYRRYIETFSPYARQFLERLDRPKAARIEGVLPSIAIDRTSPVRTPRSTVGTLTSLSDYIRALWARSSTLICENCGQPVFRASATSILEELVKAGEGRQALLCFPLSTAGLEGEALRQFLQHLGFRRVLENGTPVRLEEAKLSPGQQAMIIVLDRITISREERPRIIDSLESALHFGHGHVEIHIDGAAQALHFSQFLRCEGCGIDYGDPAPALFSFNNPIGACEKCKGFGRVIDIDPDLVIPNPRLSISEGAIKAFQTPLNSICQKDLMKYMKKHRMSVDRPYDNLSPEEKKIIWEGEPGGRGQFETHWYGVLGFFDWMHSRTYKKNVRIFLSHYRQYLTCPDCHGARLKPQALRFFIDGKTLPQVEALQIHESERFFQSLPEGDAATTLLLDEIRGRLRFLLDVGLGYLTISRHSRTLSGGEAQRVTLATALGSSLTSTLYVLDEPSVGLHPRDARALGGVLRRLAARENAVVVVEHDPDLISAADHVIDLGPGPGHRGGEVVYEGPMAGLIDRQGSRTAEYLRGEITIPSPPGRRHPQKWLKVIRARENNLKNITVTLPLGVLVCVTGISGSGKSTLVEQVLYRTIRRSKGLSESEPGACDGVEGADLVEGPVIVDQAPPGKTSRMNAATYLGILEPLRRQFAGTEEALIRELGPSAFSFNSQEGACPHCLGAGFEKLKMQFLPDVLVRCPGCDGRRFRQEVLDVRCRGFNIAEMLDKSALEVKELFSDVPAVVKAIEPLLDIGLGYLSLSQPAPTLSGGEAQRLKLARDLAKARESRNLLYILDEPTTGLHAADVSTLAGALQKLVDAGHSVVVVEHHMELAWAADWIIDLGPEGGNEGGFLTGEGTPETIAGLSTHTGMALKNTSGPVRLRNEWQREHAINVREAPPVNGGTIVITGARQNNLKNLHVDVPRHRLVAVTGVSGSGKSTLAFDILFAEGQRRFLDCLPTYARQFIRPLSRPEVDRVEGIPPTSSLEQKLSRGTPLSTAGTSSEVYHYLRLLFAALGVPHCPRCGIPGEVADPAALAENISRDFSGRNITILAPLVRKRKGQYRKLVEGLAKRGIESVRIDGTLSGTGRPPRIDRYSLHDIEAVVAIMKADRHHPEALHPAVAHALQLSGGVVMASAEEIERFYSTRRGCPRCGSGLPFPDPRLFTWSQKFGACQVCEGRGIDGDGDACPACGGSRLNPEALSVKIDGKNIGHVAALTFRGASGWLDGLTAIIPEVRQTVMPELQRRLHLLDEMGVSYLTLNRGADTLSTGEAQRIRIVAQLASNLRGVCYVLDEPTVGLHPSESEKLIGALAELRDRGNTVVVVEHDEATIRSVDHIIDLGPGAGPEGGAIVAEGTVESMERMESSATGLWLSGRHKQDFRPRRPLTGAPMLEVAGARLHNLKGLSVQFPLGRLVTITGVSGSGKSTLVRDILYEALKEKQASRKLPSTVQNIKGAELIRRVLEVDESPIGRTPRSVPATYTGIMDGIRALFASTAVARTRGYGPGRFSFNVAGGRCDTCKGQGRIEVKMSLLPIVYITCETCGGHRYNADTLAATFKGKSVADVLEMSAKEAAEFFSSFPPLWRPLDFLSRIGLGYLTLGQPSPTLSGGEAQRIKLAAELASSAGPSLYILDEPTTGLHMADVALLIKALQDLVDRGDTVLIIEHNMEVAAASDCIIDLGPGGGDEGGQVVAWGTPEEVSLSPQSKTAPYLRRTLQRRHQVIA